MDGYWAVLMTVTKVGLLTLQVVDLGACQKVSEMTGLMSCGDGCDTGWPDDIGDG